MLNKYMHLLLPSIVAIIFEFLDKSLARVDLQFFVMQMLCGGQGEGEGHGAMAPTEGAPKTELL